MQRRAALKNFALLAGAGIFSGTTISILTGCNTTGKKNTGQLFSDEQQNLITELSDVIIPTTSCPGAKAAGVGPFISMMIHDCYPEDVQKIFVSGLDDFSKSVKDDFKNDFISLSPQDRIKAVTKLRDKTLSDKKSKDDEQKNKAKFFETLRDLTILGYFTSEIGAQQATAYLPVPGKYQGDVDLKPGQKLWAAN